MAYKGGWVPFPGKKRTALEANLGDDFDDECSQVPSKLCAISMEVACEILREDEENPPPPKKETQDVPMDEDEDMGNSSGSENSFENLLKSPTAGDTANDDKCGVNQSEDLDGKECRELVTYSMHESQPKSSGHSHACNSEVLSKKDVTLVISKELRESFARRKLSEELVLQKILSSHQTPPSSSSSMMLVEWKPKPTTPLAYLTAITSPLAKEEECKIRPIKTKTDEPSSSNVCNALSVQKVYEENFPLSRSTISALLPVHPIYSSSADTDDKEESSSRMDIDIL